MNRRRFLGSLAAAPAAGIPAATGATPADDSDESSTIRVRVRCNYDRYCAEVRDFAVVTIDGTLPSGYRMPKWTCRFHRDALAVAREGLTPE